MEHIALMRKTWRLTQKILSGKKKIESRWYKYRRIPWNRISAGDRVYFKDSGEPVTIRAEVAKALQFSDLNPEKVMEILKKYGKKDGIGRNKMQKFFRIFKDRKYCILVFLKNPRRIEPFDIDKTGFGAMSSWVSIGNVNRIRIPKRISFNKNC